MNIVAATALATTLSLVFFFGAGISWANRPYGKENYAWAWWAVQLWFFALVVGSWCLVYRLM